MRGRVVLAVAVLLAVIAFSAWWWRKGRPPEAAPPPAAAAAPAAAGESAEIAAPCDPIPTTPPLPKTLEPSAHTLDAIMQALDAALSPEHKAFLTCFPDENEVVGRAHFGFARWLRITLHLRQPRSAIPELQALGVKSPDDVSAVIVRAYVRHLRRAPIDLPDIVARTRTMADVPAVTP
jgi:hypothetical protein